VTIAAGTASGPIQVPIAINNDTIIEGNLTYQVSVGTVTGGGTLTGSNSLAVTVVDNDNIVVAGNQLRILGTVASDRIIVRAVDNNGRFRVVYNAVPLGIFSNPRLFIRGANGNDTILLRSVGAAKLKVQATIIGGAGADTIDASGNTRANVLAGGAANDVLIGGSSRDILIGGSQTDTLRGNVAQDVLIGGALSFQVNDAALTALLNEWTAPGSVGARLANMRTGPNSLTSATVLDDRVLDRLFAGTGFDVFLEGPRDVDDAARGEIILRL
jgi:Ca2+-binding RTX toxin-like protein